MSAEIGGVEISYADVRESIAVARSHGEKFFEQIVWQVEREAWKILGYSSWDEMRRVEYADMGVVAPRAEQPELVARLRVRGLTQQQIGDTIGVSKPTVHRILRDVSSETSPPAIVNARGQERPASYRPRDLPPFDPAAGEVVESPSVEGAATPSDAEVEAPGVEVEPEAAPSRPVVKAPRRRPITDQFFDAAHDLRKVTERLVRICDEDRFPQNAEKVATANRSDLLRARDALDGVLSRLPETN